MAFGPSPWSSDYQSYRQELLQGYKRVTKTQLSKANLGQSMTRGWYEREKDTWGPKPKEVEKRRVRSASGRYSYVPDDAYGDTLAFARRPSNAEIEAYVDGAKWNYDTAKQHPDPCGHIARMEYSSSRSLMRVTFSQSGRMGDTVVFFRVPTAVYGTLYWLFLSGTHQMSPVSGEMRHAVGIQFWDLVRIRRTVHSTKYSFVYAEGGNNAQNSNEQ